MWRETVYKESVIDVYAIKYSMLSVCLKDTQMPQLNINIIHSQILNITMGDGYQCISVNIINLCGKCRLDVSLFLLGCDWNPAPAFPGWSCDQGWQWRLSYCEAGRAC